MSEPKTAEVKVAFAHLMRRLGEPGAFRMDDEGHIKALLADLITPASPPAETGEGFLLRFGLGELVVNTGKFGGECAVFIAKANAPGIVGQGTGRAAFDRDCLQPGEHVLLFPSVERANEVADALVNAATHPTSDQSDTERMREALRSARAEIVYRLGGNEALAASNVAIFTIDAALAEKAADQ